MVPLLINGVMTPQWILISKLKFSNQSAHGFLSSQPWWTITWNLLTFPLSEFKMFFAKNFIIKFEVLVIKRETNLDSSQDQGRRRFKNKNVN